MKVKTAKKLKVPFLISFALLLVFMFALFYQTFSLVRLANADGNSGFENVNIEKFAHDFEFVKYSYFLQDDLDHMVGNYENYGISCTDTINACCVDNAPYISGNNTITITPRVIDCDYDDNDNMINVQYNFDLLEISYLPVVNGVAVEPSECGTCDTIFIYKKENSASDIVLDIDTFQGYDVAILDIKFYIKAPLKNGLVKYGESYYFCNSNLYAYSMRPFDNYVRIFTDWWTMTRSDDTALALGGAYGVYYGALDSFRRLYGVGTVLNINSNLSKSTIEYPKDINEDEEKYWFECGFIRDYVKAYNNITLRLYCKMDINDTIRNLEFYYLDVVLPEDSSNSSTSVEPSTSIAPSTSQEPSASAELSASIEPSTSEQGGQDTEKSFVVSVKDYDGNLIGTISVGVDKRITMEELQNIVNGAFDMPLKWDSFDVDNLKTEYFDFEKDIESSLVLSPAECDITVCDENGDLVVKFNVPYGATIDEQFINDKIGNDFSSKYFINVFDVIMPFNFENQILYDLKLYPIMHNVTIYVDDGMLVYGVVRNDTVIDVDFITEQLTKKSADKVYTFNVEHIAVNDFKKGYSDVAVGYVVDSEYTSDVYVWLSDVVESEKEQPTPPTSEDDTKPSDDTKEDDNGNIPTDEVGESGCNHKWQFKFFDFPCENCGTTIWAFLWIVAKNYIAFVVAGVVLIAVLWLAFTKIRG